MIRTKATNKRLRDEIQHNRERILNIFSRRCQVCGLNVTELLEIHHLFPISKGGGNEWDNLSLLCPTCHKALHIWKDNNNGSKIINEQYRDFIGWDQYNRLGNIMRKSIKKNNEYVKNESSFFKELNESKGEPNE